MKVKPFETIKDWDYLSDNILEMWAESDKRLSELSRGEYDVEKQNQELGYRKCLHGLMHRGIGPWIIW